MATKMFPGWFKSVRDLSAQSRKDLVEVVYDNIKRHGSQRDTVTSEGSEMVADLRRNYELVGFSPCVMYLKVSTTKADMPATFVHPWAMVTLVFKHKRLPTLLHVNAAMRKDEMMLAEIPCNSAVFDAIEARGITG